MARLTRKRTWLRTSWRSLRIPFWIAFGLFFGFFMPYTLVLNHRVQSRFEDLVFSVPTRVFARPLVLAAGTPMTAAMLKLELDFARYTHDDQGQRPGSWSRDGDDWIISSRGYTGINGPVAPRRVRVLLGAGEVIAVRDLATGEPVVAHLDPAQIATLYGARQIDRRIVHLAQVPPLLVTGLQAVEDRSFKSNIGIDFGAILRALLADLRAGSSVQGGSTLTQQLVRNLFLSRRQTLTRKLNEALMSVLLDVHYSKGRILQAYINEVFLGQQGSQSVRGFAAAASFYFGRRLQDLRPQEIAMLVGMLKGPSYYNPRLHPKRARTRRNLVLHIFARTGLITPEQLHRAQASPLGLARHARLPHNRFPAFMDLVRRQTMHDFDEKTLRTGGLSIYTTLDPGTQLYAEQAVQATIQHLGQRAIGVQAAGVVTDAQTGSVLAVLGSRTPGDPGFNRALDAYRPVGSIIKPFVYLVALHDPMHWNLATQLSDAPISIAQPDGSTWTPQNDDHRSHGLVPMVDALAHSWNLASIRLGMNVGLSRIQTFLKSFGLNNVGAGPALLIGAVELSPIQVAQMYGYFASGGHALPLLAVRGVVNRDGKVIKRYQVRSEAGQYQRAVGLVTWAMQQVTRYGTARAIGHSHLAWLHAAGKTGTSNDMRDSWFVGFTATHLAAFWMGRDDNRPTTLFGSSGAMYIWRKLFARLPTKPLSPDPAAGLEMAWVNPANGKRIESTCKGAMQVPVIAGSLSNHAEGCFWQRIGHLLGDDAPSSDSASGEHH